MTTAGLPDFSCQDHIMIEYWPSLRHLTPMGWMRIWTAMLMAAAGLSGFGHFRGSPYVLAEFHTFCETTCVADNADASPNHCGCLNQDFGIASKPASPKKIQLRNHRLVRLPSADLQPPPSRAFAIAVTVPAELVGDWLFFLRLARQPRAPSTLS
jgi:hypothetical protein